MELKELVQLAQAGDQTAMEEVCRRFAGLVKKLSFQAHLRTLGEDAMAEGWLAVSRAIRTYDFGTGVPVAGYIENCVRYALWNLFKRERRRWQHEVPASENAEDSECPSLLHSLVADNDVAGEVESSWLDGEMQQALSHLPERQREVVALCVLEGVSLTEIAARTGVTPQAVYNLRQRGLRRLKASLSGMYVNERG